MNGKAILSRWDGAEVRREVGQWALALAIVGVVMLVLSPQAYATSSGMPWDSTINKIVDSLNGPIARLGGILAVVITGLAFALGEGGQMFKRGLAVAFGLSIAFSATSFIQQLGFGGSSVI